jgi:hypothetical protein
MTRNYEKLADNLVNINNTFSSREEAIAIMKERLKKITIDKPENTGNVVFQRNMPLAQQS